MVITLDVRLNRHCKVYNENEIIRGIVTISSKNELKHDGIVLSMEGQVNLQLSAKTVGIFESFYQSVKPIQLLSFQVDLVKAGKLAGGKTEISFEAPLKAKYNRILYETYHGVFINVQYSLKCEIKRSFLIGNSLAKTTEFIIEYGQSPPTGQQIPPSPSLDLFTPADMKRIGFEMMSEIGTKLGFFRAHGHIDSLVCPISKPFTGEIIIDKSEFPIKSIEVQLVRVETCGCAEGFAKDGTVVPNNSTSTSTTSEIQTIQIGDGDVFKGLPIPIFMIFPRLFACPTLSTTNFKIGYILIQFKLS